ncbi:MAG: cupin domain-containing protein [Anaerolineae bacterium]|nr:cupin domain-containing protein [Anaerolineae bacterium]
MSDRKTFSRYAFRDHTGYMVAPWFPGVDHRPVTIRHSASATPWKDADTHLHTSSEEYYFVFQGELRLLVDGTALTLKPDEVLMVKPGVTHAVVGGSSPIEHLLLRMPAAEDRQTVGGIPVDVPIAADGGTRTVRAQWGCRVPLAEAQYQNCWLFGVGEARFHSDVMCLAYVHFSSAESLDTDGHPHRLHLHRESWEFYTVLRGTRILRIEDELVEVHAGEILAVPPGVKHVLHGTHTPFEGIEFRVPRLNDKVVF